MPSETIPVPNHLHKFIIGPKGAVVNNIKATSGDPALKVTCNGDQVVIESANASALASAKQQVMQIWNEHKNKLDLNAMNESITYKVPKQLHKYAIGDAGATIKQIQADTKSVVTMDGDSLTIKSSSKSNVEKAYQLVLNALKNFGWHLDPKTNTFIEKNLTDELFAKYRTKVTKEHEKMAKCYEDAQNAFKNGKKDEAKKLSEQGKKHQELRDQYQKEAALQTFKEMNKGREENVIDFHGLLVQEALDFLEQRLAHLAKTKHSFKTLNVITGAGNHSEVSAKIKPEIAKVLDAKKMKYVKGNDGVFVVTL